MSLTSTGISLCSKFVFVSKLIEFTNNNISIVYFSNNICSFYNPMVPEKLSRGKT